MNWEEINKPNDYQDALHNPRNPSSCLSDIEPRFGAKQPFQLVAGARSQRSRHQKPRLFLSHRIDITATEHLDCTNASGSSRCQFWSSRPNKTGSLCSS